MHKFTIFRKADEPDLRRASSRIRLLEFDDAFEACFECIRMEQKTGLKYEVRVTEPSKQVSG